MVNSRKVTTFFTIVFLNFIFIFLLLLTSNLKFSEVVLLINLFFVFIYYIDDLVGNIVPLMFVFFLFTFILYTPIMSLLVNTEKLYYSEQSSLISNIILIFSLLGLFTGFFLSEFKETNNKLSIKSENHSYYSFSSFVLVLITTPFAIVSLIQSLERVFISGYVGLYKESSISMIDRIGNFNLTFIYIYLATLPTYNSLKKTLFLIVPLLTMGIFTGRRGEAVINIVVLLTYFVIRKTVIEKEFIQINYKLILKLIIVAVLIIVISIAVSQIRLGNSIDLSNVFSQFFEQQSGQYKNIEFVILNKDLISSLSSDYSLQALYNGTTVSKFLINLFRGKSQDTMFFENNLSNVITYYRDVIYYNLGGRFGISYIAEAYVDFGYSGVFFINIFYGFFTGIFKKLNVSSWIIFSFALLIIRDIYFMPRESTFNWINQIFSTTNILSIILVIFLGLILKSLTRKSSDNYQRYMYIEY